MKQAGSSGYGLYFGLDLGACRQTIVHLSIQRAQPNEDENEH